MTIDIVLLLILIVVNGVFAMSEMAIAASRKARLQQWADDGDSGAAAALHLAEHPNRFLATVQIGITLIGIVIGFFGGARLSDPVVNQIARIEPLRPYAGVIAVLIVVAIVT